MNLGQRNLIFDGLPPIVSITEPGREWRSTYLIRTNTPTKTHKGATPNKMMRTGSAVLLATKWDQRPPKKAVNNSKGSSKYPDSLRRQMVNIF